nr:hypothetical protein [Azospirillum sp. B510]
MTASGLLTGLLELYLRHHAHDGDVERGDLAEVGRVQLDIVEVEAVIEIGGVRQPSAQTVDALRHHEIEAAAPGIIHQLQKARAVPGGAADRGVRVGIDNLPALLDGVTPAQLDLVGDRFLALLVGRVARVDHGAEPGVLEDGHRKAFRENAIRAARRTRARPAANVMKPAWDGRRRISWRARMRANPSSFSSGTVPCSCWGGWTTGVVVAAVESVVWGTGGKSMVGAAMTI